ncbi:MAG: glycosyltransferase family 2 protein [Chloroflexi bacterium]|nr:glycosyltransferase family 2 protein [Chloroflexota bacterium]
MNREAKSQTHTTTPLVSVVILNHNGAAIVDMLRRSVDSILAQNAGPVELFIVDDNSTDGSDAQVQALCAEVDATFLSTRDGPHGISAARNVAIPHLRGEYVAFLDNDAIPQPGWLAALVRAMEADESLGEVASRVMFADKPDIVNSLGSVLNELFHGNGVGIHQMVEYVTIPDEIMYATGNGMLLRRSAIEQVGDFDDGYLYYGPDDADYGMRLWRAGWRIAPVPDAIVLHLHSFSKKQAGMPFWDGRNRIRMALKHQSWRELPRFVLRDILHSAAPRQLWYYVRCWGSTLTHGRGLRALLAYRWQHRGEPAYAAVFRRFLMPPQRMLVTPDNRAYGRTHEPLTTLVPGEADECFLYHGWYWPERWANWPMRWAMRSASLVCTLPAGPQTLQWRLLPQQGAEQTVLTLLVQRWSADGYTTVDSQHLTLPGPPGVEPCTVTTAHDLPAGPYRLLLVADAARTENGFFPRQIGFGLAGLTRVEGS